MNERTIQYLDAVEPERLIRCKCSCKVTSMTTMLEQGQKVVRGEAPPPPIARLLGLVVKSIEPGHAVFEMEADERHHNPLGTMHGGVYCDLADAAMGYAYGSTLGEGETFTTIELKINFLRAVRMETLTAEAKVVKTGNTLGYVECDIKEQTGKLVARAASTCLKLRKGTPTVSYSIPHGSTDPGGIE